MPQQNEPVNPILLILIAAVAIWWWKSQPPSPVPPTPDDQHEIEVKPDPSQQDYWSGLAICVDKTSFGTLQQHTDHLLQIVDILKGQGKITDDSRVSEWRGKRVEITDDNRATIAATLRGQ